MRDITERKRAVDALRESQAKLSAAMASMTDAVSISDSEGRFIDFNDAFATFHRFKSKDECAKSFADFKAVLEIFCADGTPLPVDQWPVPRALRGETMTNTEYILRRKDTGDHWFGSYSYGPIRGPGGAIVGSVVTRRDITERKQAEAKLRESEERFRTMADGLAFMVWVHGPDGEQQFVNKTFCDYFGVSHEEIRAGSWQMLLHPEDASAYLNEFLACVRDRRPFHAETRVKNSAGAWRWIESFGKPRFTSTGEFLGFVGVSPDITERKQAEQSLRQAVERYEEQVRLFDAVASTTPDFVYLFDPNGRFLYANRQLLEVYGMTLPNVVGKTCRELGYEQWHHDMHMREIAQVIETKRPIKGEVPFKAPLTGISGVYEYIFAPRNRTRWPGRADRRYDPGCYRAQAGRGSAAGK